MGNIKLHYTIQVDSYGALSIFIYICYMSRRQKRKISSSIPLVRSGPINQLAMFCDLMCIFAENMKIIINIRLEHHLYKYTMVSRRLARLALLFLAFIRRACVHDANISGCRGHYRRDCWLYVLSSSVYSTCNHCNMACNRFR